MPVECPRDNTECYACGAWDWRVTHYANYANELVPRLEAVS